MAVSVYGFQPPPAYGALGGMTVPTGPQAVPPNYRNPENHQFLFSQSRMQCPHPMCKCRTGSLKMKSYSVSGRNMLKSQALPAYGRRICEYGNYHVDAKYTKPLTVDTATEYELPRHLYPPKHSEPILMIHPGYRKYLEIKHKFARMKHMSTSATSLMNHDVHFRSASHCSSVCDSSQSMAGHVRHSSVPVLDFRGFSGADGACHKRPSQMKPSKSTLCLNTMGPGAYVTDAIYGGTPALPSSSSSSFRSVMAERCVDSGCDVNPFKRPKSDAVITNVPYSQPYHDSGFLLASANGSGNPSLSNKENACGLEVGQAKESSVYDETPGPIVNVTRSSLPPPPPPYSVAVTSNRPISESLLPASKQANGYSLPKNPYNQKMGFDFPSSKGNSLSYAQGADSGFCTPDAINGGSSLPFLPEGLKPMHAVFTLIVPARHACENRFLSSLPLNCGIVPGTIDKGREKKISSRTHLFPSNGPLFEMGERGRDFLEMRFGLSGRRIGVQTVGAPHA
ncbi:unnamed protein product [Darwinula stevensoni]|uniref:Uncharacterized protein n=1 Tax=Darwinula stevensoni TaxID=69355 RepID=A0A7R9A2U4_9CRUS|nr:unnamed protein product [Darwinula stevensoni]CAG0880659.1 unnamed protein product [Darwinula stevensoni]